MTKNKRNKTKARVVKNYFNDLNRKCYIDLELITQRQQANLRAWEEQTKYPNLPYKPTVAQMVKNGPHPTRLLINSKDTLINEKMGYLFIKHLVNAGVSPSKIKVFNLDDIYLYFRGIGEEAKNYKDSLFDNELQAILIEGVHKINETTVKSNAEQFWVAFTDFLKRNPKLHLILCARDDEDWVPKALDIPNRLAQCNIQTLEKGNK